MASPMQGRLLPSQRATSCDPSLSVTLPRLSTRGGSAVSHIGRQSSQESRLCFKQLTTLEIHHQAPEDRGRLLLQ